jgi:hypothetical protein
MNYLTNYYKNLSEQLQEQINILEANIRSASEIKQIGTEELEKALRNKEIELGRRLTRDERSAIIDQIVGSYTRRSLNRESLIKRATEQLPVVAQSGDVQTATQFADVMGDISRINITGKVAGYRNFDPSDAKELQSTNERIAQLGKGMRSMGMQTSVPADIAAMRKVVQMGKGRYQPPLPTPQTMHVTPSHY